VLLHRVMVIGDAIEQLLWKVCAQLSSSSHAVFTIKSAQW
jgi:hypothetical protein